MKKLLLIVSFLLVPIAAQAQKTGAALTFGGANSPLRTAGGVIRPSISPGGAGSTITWEFLTAADNHGSVFFTGVSTSGSQLVISYPTVSKVISLTVTPDETLAGFGVVIGCSVGTTSAICNIYRAYQDAGFLTYNGSGWSKSNSISHWLTSGTGSALEFALPNSYFGANGSNTFSARYAGPNQYYVERKVSGLATYNNGLQLRKMSDGTTVSGGSLTTSDIIEVSSGANKLTQLSASTVDGTLLGEQIFTTSSNFWIHGLFEM